MTRVCDHMECRRHCHCHQSTTITGACTATKDTPRTSLSSGRRDHFFTISSTDLLLRSFAVGSSSLCAALVSGHRNKKWLTSFFTSLPKSQREIRLYPCTSTDSIANRRFVASQRNTECDITFSSRSAHYKMRTELRRESHIHFVANR